MGRLKISGRSVAIIILALAMLAVIDRASLLIAPCGVGGGGYSDQKRADDDNCAVREGIIIAGIEWLSERSPEAWTALATIAVAAFTLTLWLSSEKLWRITRISTVVSRRAARAAKQSADIARDALITTERAFVFVEDFDTPISLVRRGSGTRGFEVSHLAVRPLWQNNGNTPTKDMTVIVNWTPWGGDLPDGFSYAYGEGVRPSPMFLGPKATEWSAPININTAEATKALKGTQNIFVWGRTDYRDIFDGSRPHFTQWCYKMVFVRGAPNPLIQYVAFGPYNGSDEDEGNS